MSAPEKPGKELSLKDAVQVLFTVVGGYIGWKIDWFPGLWLYALLIGSLTGWALGAVIERQMDKKTQEIGLSVVSIVFLGFLAWLIFG